MAIAQKSPNPKARIARGKFVAAGAYAKITKTAPRAARPPKLAVRKMQSGLTDREDAALVNAISRAAAAALLAK